MGAFDPPGTAHDCARCHQPPYFDNRIGVITCDRPCGWFAACYDPNEGESLESAIDEWNKSQEAESNRLLRESADKLKSAVSRDSAFHKDSGKPRVELVAPQFIEGIAQVLGFGCDKYGPRNWELYADEWDWTRLGASLERHLLAWKRREDFDPESGLHHLLHAGCDLMMLYTLIATGHGKDDRTELVPPELAHRGRGDAPSHPEGSDPD